MDQARTGSPIQGFVAPDAVVRIVRAEQARVEEIRLILPRQDHLGWRMAKVRSPEGRLELVSPELCGSRGIHLSIVTLPAGTEDAPHFHVSGEKVMYVTAGRGLIRCGLDLELEHGVGVGDAVYVPPYAVHAPVAVGDEPFVFVMASNAPLDVSVPGGRVPTTDQGSNVEGRDAAKRSNDTNQNGSV
jgi:uncharacterized RmlC-like cupin family protein